MYPSKLSITLTAWDFDRTFTMRLLTHWVQTGVASWTVSAKQTNNSGISLED